MTPRWQAALGQALVGEEFELEEAVRPDTARLVGQLAGHGWDAARIRRHALARQEAELPWPHPVDPALRRGLGAAQFQAALMAAREALGVVTLASRTPSGRTTWILTR